MKVSRDNVSVINRDCLLEGRFEFNGYLIVAGSIKGILRGETVVTREGSRIQGEVKIDSFTVAGDFEGEIVADSLTLLKSADVKGKVRCANLIVEEGGLLNAAVEWKKSEVHSS